MRATTVDFVSYAVNDLDDAIAFYRDELGLVLETHLPDVGWAEFGVPPTTLALWEPGEDDATSPGGGGGSVAFAVDDVEAAVEDLASTDATVLTEPSGTGVCEQAVVTDPDGNRFLLHRRHDGTHGRVDEFPAEVRD